MYSLIHSSEHLGRWDCSLFWGFIPVLPTLKGLLSVLWVCCQTSPPNYLWFGKHRSCAHFIDEETEAQGGSITNLRTHSQQEPPHWPPILGQPGHPAPPSLIPKDRLGRAPHSLPPPTPVQCSLRPLCHHLAKMPAVISHHGRGVFRHKTVFQGCPLLLGPPDSPREAKVHAVGGLHDL